MNRQWMKRIFIIIVVACLLLCGCGKKETEETQQSFAKETQQRFAVEYKQTFGLASLYIIRDTETGKAYLFALSGYAGGVTILVEGEG